MTKHLDLPYLNYILDVISDETKNKYNQSIWREVSDFKERLHNKYFGVDLDILWDLLNNYLPFLKNHILKIKEDFK